MVAALYRRYRPETFAEMIGQSQVTEPLMTALRTERIGHAYLFSGPRGCGKTTSARVLARCLNCAEGPTDTPCGVCPSCVELSRDGGGSLDVVEIDAASHGGVEDARDLRERAVFAPARDRFKIFIIDEAHMVTAGGFNALLKIVEEPPPHVKFIFATTEPEKVIGTIRSRTHHYPFRLIAPATLIDYVQSLCDSEGVRVEPGVLPLVVRAGGGSVRDTLSILDQLIAGSEDDAVTAHRAAGLLGFTHTELLDDVVVAFGTHDAAAAFRATDRVVQTGQDPRRFVEDLLERLRDLIVVSATTVDGAAAVFRGVPEDQLSRMFDQAQAFRRGELSRIADTVSDALDKMAGATAPRLQLELMIARAIVAQEEHGGRVAPAAHTGAGVAGSAGTPGGPQTAGHQGASAPVSGGSAVPGRRPAQNVPQAPPAPAEATPKVDPLAALADLRAAVNAPAPTSTPDQRAAASAPVATVPVASAPVDPSAAASEPVPTPVGEVPDAAAEGSATPNAAQTAASVRQFLESDNAGAVASSPQSDASPPNVHESQNAPEADASATAPATPVPSAPAPEATATTPPVRPADATPGMESSAHHPNTGAATFGRPISDILSASQIESIGTAPTSAGTPSSQQPAAPQAPQSGAPQSGAPTPTPDAPEPASRPGQAAAPDATNGSTETTSAPEGVTDDDTESAHAGFDDLVELWPELLDELQEADRDAWNAVRSITPLGLEGDVLKVGVANQSDLAAFKARGAGPLRETILSATGLSVKYLPRPMPAGGATPQGVPRETSGGAATQTPAPNAAAEEPSPTASAPGTRPSHTDSDPVARAAARLSALGPAMSAPAWADPPPAPPKSQATAPSTAHATEPDAEQATEPKPAAARSAPAGSAAPVPAPQAADAPPSGITSTPQEAAEVPTASAPLAQSAHESSVSSMPTEETSTPRAAAAPSGVPTAAPDPSVGDFGAFADDPYDDGDPYADGDPFQAGDRAVQPVPAPVIPAQASSALATPANAAGPQLDRAEKFSPASATPGGAAEKASPAPSTTPTPSNSLPGSPLLSTTRSAAPTASVAPSVSPASSAPARPETSAARTAPAFTRYGEAVVREVLGARFIEERPLPPRLEA